MTTNLATPRPPRTRKRRRKPKMKSAGLMIPPPNVIEGEVLDGEHPVGHVRVLALKNPFTLARTDEQVREGATLGEILRSINLPDWQNAMVSIDGEPVPMEWWDRVRPRAGHVVVIRTIPRGGGGSGGGGNKGWMQIIAGIVIIIAAIAISIISYGTMTPFATAMVVAGIGMVIGGAITLLMPPPSLPKLKTGSGNDSPVFSITGSRNQANPYGAVPRVYGRHRIFPLFGALPFTEIVGNTQYLRELFVLGYGPLQLSEFKIGETLIENFQEVEMEVRQGYLDDAPMTLFPGDVFEEPLSILLSRNFTTNPPVEPEPVRLTHGAVDEWSVDFVFTGGIYSIDGDGQLVGYVTPPIRIWYRKLGDTDWILASSQTYSGATPQPLRRSFRQVVAERAQYEIRMHQTGGTLGSTGLGSVTDGATWAVLRSVLYQDPITLPGLCKVSLRIRATDQLNGVVDQFNCIAESILPEYDVDTDTWIERVTSSPAASFRNILQGSANARPLPDNRLDLPSIQAWHADCAAAGRTFSFVVEQATTVAELLRQVVGVGRASLGSVDGTFGVVRDVPQTVPVQHFTPRNSRDFRGAKLFRDIPHALKVRFINPATNWELDERFVYDDGFDESNATKFEAIQFFGVTDPDQAFKEARYHLAAAKLRPEVYEFVTDIEHLVCTRGDLIRVTHDVPLFGIGFGRVTAVAVNGAGDALSVGLDDPVPMLQDGTRYTIRFRRSDGVSVVREVSPITGLNSVVAFTTAIPVNDIPAIGDLFQFGVLGEESVEVIVTRIEMLKDLGARITGVDAAPDIHQADTGPIPPHNSHITRPPDIFQLSRPTPIVDDIRSDESVMVRGTDGTLAARIVVFLHFRSAAATAPAEAVDVRYRIANSDDDWQQISLSVSGDATQVSIAPVTEGALYDLRLRGISPRTGQVSEWVEVDGYLVVGQSTPPPDVPTLFLEGLQLRWTYPLEPVDFDGFLVRRHRGTFPSWETSQPLHEGVISDTQYNLLRADVGTVTYLVKAVDVGGHVSVTAATLTFTHADPNIQNAILTVDKKALGFPGTYDGVIVGGNLEANTVNAFWPTADTSPFWTPLDASLFWGNQYGGLSYLTSLLPTAGQIPCDIVLQVTVDADSWSLKYRQSGLTAFWGLDAALFWGPDTDLFWEVGAQEFLPWPGRLVDAAQAVYEFLLEVAPGPDPATVSEYLVILDAPDIRETFNDVTIAATTGTRLNLTRNYRAIKNVSATLEDDGGTAVTARVFDKDPALGPLIKTLNAANAAVAGLIDAEVVGY